MEGSINFAVLTAIAALTACAYAPTGPSVMALPGAGVSFGQFRQDDSACRQFASGQIGGGTVNQAAVDS